jgi:hypothetical protein
MKNVKCEKVCYDHLKKTSNVLCSQPRNLTCTSAALKKTFCWQKKHYVRSQNMLAFLILKEKKWKQIEDIKTAITPAKSFEGREQKKCELGNRCSLADWG